MDSSVLSLVFIIFLICFSAFFSASETAFTGLNKPRLKARALNGETRAEKVLALAEEYDRLLSGILIGNNIVNIASATLATLLFVRLLGSAGSTVSTVVMTIVVLLFGEIAPKSIAKQMPEKTALMLYPPLHLILNVLKPLIWLFSLWQKLMYRVFKPADDPAITEEELMTIVEEAESDGEIDADESELIRSAIEFTDTTAEDILTPRVDVTAVDIEDSEAEIDRAFRESGFSRLPVYEESIDNIIGILHEKDYFTNKGKKSIREMMTRPLCVVPTTGLLVMLTLFRESKNHMAVVMDEYGGVIGIVTLEDVLEELVGEIWDEHDEVIEEIKTLEDGTFSVMGGAALDDLREYIDIPESYDSVTVNGWVLEVLGRFPQNGDGFDFEDYHVTVEKVTRRRVEQIRITRKE